VRIIERLQAARLIRDRHFRAELLRLIVRTRHQGHAADSGRKAQIILDPRRSAGLSAKRAAVEHENGQSFRCRVDRGGKPGRTCADDNYVIEAIWIDRIHQPDAAGEFGLTRIAQQLSSRAEHDR